MSSPLSVLILEDNLADFELIANELARFGFTARCERVETEADFAVRLQERPDVILANNSLAGFDNLRALEILHESGLVIPFIVLTGAISEDSGRRMHEKRRRGLSPEGAHLWVGPAVQRALGEAELRRQKVAAEQALRRKNFELEDVYRRALAASPHEKHFSGQHDSARVADTADDAVIGFSELLVDGKAGTLNPVQQDFTQDILANGKHLLSLVNDVLDLARVESGTMPFHPGAHLPARSHPRNYCRAPAGRL